MWYLLEGSTIKCHHFFFPDVSKLRVQPWNQFITEVTFYNKTAVPAGGLHWMAGVGKDVLWLPLQAFYYH